MQNTITFEVSYPPGNEELGLSLESLGRFTIVSQSSAQSELYGVKYEDRILSINGVSCDDLDPGDVAQMIRSNLNNLKITYKRSFKPDEMDGLNKLVSSPVQNDFLFYEGSLLLSLGMGNEPFQLRTIRIVRVTGPLLLFAENDKLIPFGIALLWYSSSDPAKVKYKDTPFGGMNLLPCTISPRGGQNNYFIIEFRGGRNIRITNQERGPLLDFIEAVSTVYPRDLSSVITMFSTNMPSATPNRNPMNPMNPSENSLGSYRSTLNIPYPYQMMDSVAHLYNGQLSQAFTGFEENLDKLLLTGFHPEQLSHSLTALFIHAKQFVNAALWDEKVQTSIRNIIVKLSLRSADYLRTTVVRPAGFLVFCSGDRDCSGIFRDRGGYFMSDAGYCLLHRDATQWVLLNKAGVPVYAIDSSDLVPPRFNWTVLPNMQAPGRWRGEEET
ncbi:hypothetical protein WA588_002323 [Blastocystis sp. NMH]